MDRIVRIACLSFLLCSPLLFAAPTRAQSADTAATPTPIPTPTPTANAAKGSKETLIELTDGVRHVWRTPAVLGIRRDQAGGVSVDQAALKKALERIAPKFHQAPVNAKPYMFQKRFYLYPGSDGRALDVAETAGKITARLEQSPQETSFEVALIRHAPALTMDRLKGITGVLSTFETLTTADRRRDHNVAIAAGKIDATLLAPGETFSLNGTVGERTRQSGFQTAHVFVDARVVEGIGGGVSQVTGTLFNAAALAGLSIKEVNPHSRPVAYLPLGRDATVAYGDKDLKFTNNTSAPIYIQYSFPDNRHLRATIYGAVVPGRTVVLRPRVQHLGPGRINVQLYRLIKDRGRVVSKERLFTHAYRWDPSTPSP